MARFTKGDRVRVDIPDESDPEHDDYHGAHGTVVGLLEDDAATATGDDRDATLFEVELETGNVVDFRRRDLRPPLE